MVKSHESSRHLVIDDFCDYLCVKKILIPAFRFTHITADVESCWVASWVTSWSLMFTTDLSHLSHYSSGATHVNSKCHALSTMEAMQLQSYALFWLFQAIQRKLCFFYPPPPSNVFMRDKGRIIYLEMGGGGWGRGGRFIENDEDLLNMPWKSTAKGNEPGNERDTRYMHSLSLIIYIKSCEI